ncbi:MAG TPA: PP2C family serine/threonine-protein phosphatase [Puia sp.]|jgi:serine/threonine protein phosphatase PrpC|nr:PP2C family serine/threonine-protein phosphatase [Puia sp.]
MQVTQIDYLHEIGSKKNQEDYLWPEPGMASPEDHIFIVCDGVGGSEGGEVASMMISEWVGTSLEKTPPSEVDLPLINRLLEEARAKLVEHATLKGLSTDMATTFTLLQLVKEKAFIAWCGDSRVYHLRKNEILFRTDDHSLVNSLIRKGELTEEEGRSHPQKNLLLKAVRADDPKPEAEGHWITDIQEGDYFLLCTDGLLENISDADVLFLLHQNELGEINLVKAFRQYALDKTRDNYSMYLIRVSPEPVEAEPEPRNRRGLRRRIGWLLFLFLILVAAAAFIIKENYFTPHKEINILVPVNRDKDSMEKAEADSTHSHQP